MRIILKPALRYFYVICSIAITATASSPTKTTLWDGQAPGATGTAAADIPTLEVYRPGPSIANGSAILMVPGGAYGTVVMGEAEAARGYWVPKGFVVAVLTYRVAPYKYPVPMWDVKRAMRTVRSMADEWDIVNSRIGILGCSAGGHLASYLATHYDTGDPQAADSIDRFPCRPDFCIFVYPVITMDASFTHAGSRGNLLGNNPSQALVDSLSNEKQVTENTPPAFCAHGTVDDVVPWKNSQEFHDACTASQVDAKFHKITSGCGGHGFGYTCENWADTCFRWLKDGGYLDAPTSPGKSPERSGHMKYAPYSDNGDYAIFDLSGSVVSIKNGVAVHDCRHAAKPGRRGISNGLFIVAKKVGGHYSPVEKNSTVDK